jgi:hypothetical protein
MMFKLSGENHCRTASSLMSGTSPCTDDPGGMISDKDIDVAATFGSPQLRSLPANVHSVRVVQ